MEPKPSLHFLGTAGGNSILSQQKFSGGIVVQYKGEQLHIDPGPGALTRLKECGLNPRETSSILVSHCHLGHCNDVNVLIDSMTYNGLEKRGTLICNKSFFYGYLNERPFLMKSKKRMLRKYFVLNSGEKTHLNEIEIQALPTKHSDSNCIGFKIITKDFIIVYSSDTSYLPEFKELYKNADILILNNQYTFKVKNKNHLSSSNSVKLIKHVKPKLTILTHFGPKLIEKNPIYEAREIQRLCSTQVVAAVEGMVINPVDNIKRNKQRYLQI